MTCPYCRSPHDPVRDGRFCAACGLSVEAARRAEVPDETHIHRCAECARVQPKDTARCRFCGARQKGDQLP